MLGAAPAQPPSPTEQLLTYQRWDTTWALRSSPLTTVIEKRSDSLRPSLLYSAALPRLSTSTQHQDCTPPPSFSPTSAPDQHRALQLSSSPPHLPIESVLSFSTLFFLPLNLKLLPCVLQGSQERSPCQLTYLDLNSTSSAEVLQFQKYSCLFSSCNVLYADRACREPSCDSSEGFHKAFPN